MYFILQMLVIILSMPFLLIGFVAYFIANAVSGGFKWGDEVLRHIDRNGIL